MGNDQGVGGGLELDASFDGFVSRGSASLIERIEALAGGAALEVLETLPAGVRDAVRARVVDGRPYPEIAAELRCSQSVVRKRVSRGVRAMRAKMEAKGNE